MLTLLAGLALASPIEAVLDIGSLETEWQEQRLDGGVATFVAGGHTVEVQPGKHGVRIRDLQTGSERSYALVDGEARFPANNLVTGGVGMFVVSRGSGKRVAFGWERPRLHGTVPLPDGPVLVEILGDGGRYDDRNGYVDFDVDRDGVVDPRNDAEHRRWRGHTVQLDGTLYDFSLNGRTLILTPVEAAY